MQRNSSTTRRGLRGMLLTMIAEDPPSWPGERWFNEDLYQLDDAELRREQRRVQLRLLLTDRQDLGCWPATWLAQRLACIEVELRGHYGLRDA